MRIVLISVTKNNYYVTYLKHTLKIDGHDLNLGEASPKNKFNEHQKEQTEIYYVPPAGE